MATLTVEIVPNIIEAGGTAEVRALLSGLPEAQDALITIEVPGLGLTGQGTIHINAPATGKASAVASLGMLTADAVDPLLWHFQAP